MLKLAVIAALVAAAPRGALANPGEAAKGFAESGKSAFDAGDFDKALGEFGFTFLMAASPNAAYNIAATLERLNRFHEAAVAFERYLQLVGKPHGAADSTHQAKVRERAETDRQRAGEATTTTPLDEAKRANAAAKYAFEHKDYDTAIAQFLRAYLLAPNAALVFNLGVAVESTGHFHQAALVFDRFLEMAPPPTNDNEQQLQQRTRARADADRYRKEGGAPAESVAAPVAPAAPAVQVQVPAADPSNNAVEWELRRERGYRLQQNLVQARKSRNHANALIAFGTIFAVGGFAMGMSGLAVAVNAHYSGDRDFGGGMFGGGMLLVGGVGTLMLGFGSTRYKSTHHRVDEIEAELDRANGIRTQRE